MLSVYFSNLWLTWVEILCGGGDVPVETLRVSSILSLDLDNAGRFTSSSISSGLVPFDKDNVSVEDVKVPSSFLSDVVDDSANLTSCISVELSARLIPETEQVHFR